MKTGITLSCFVILLIQLVISVPVKAQDILITPYIFIAFQEGTIVTKGGNRLLSKVNYNTLEEKMYLLKENFQVAINPSMQIDSVLVAHRQFIRVNNAFYEVLLDDRVSLFIQHSSKLSQLSSSDGYGNSGKTSANNTISFTRDPVSKSDPDIPKGYQLISASKFWIYFNTQYDQISSIKHLKKAFPKYKDALKAYNKEEKTDFSKKSDVIDIIEFVNTLD